MITNSDNCRTFLIVIPGGFEEFFEAVTFDFNGDDVPS
jgi:hypothetical protein